MSEPTQEPTPTPDPVPEPTPEPVPDTAVGWLPGGPVALFGEGATAEETYDLLTVDVPAERWITALETARDRLGCTFFDWLSAVDEPGTGFRVCAHLAALPGALPGGGGGPRRLLLRTTVPHEAPALPTAVGVYAGAAWHERETHEMFGIDFPGHPHLAPLLLPDAFEGHPLRKDFVLAARVAKAWPGAKEPGEAADGGPKRRQMLPPGVPDPNEWGPLKGQLPPAPARPARAPRAAGDRPVRRTRTAGEGSATQTEAAAAPVRRARSAADGSASQAEAAAAPRRARSAADGSASQAEGAAPARRTRSAADGSAGQTEAAAAPPRRTRSASEGSASQTDGAAAPARRTRSAADGSASQAPEDTAPARSAADGSASQPGEPAPRRTRPAAAGSSDAPWHHARPAFDEAPEKPEKPEKPGAPEDSTEPQTSPRRDGAQPERRSPAVPESPSGEAEAEASGAPESPSGEAPGAEPAAGTPGGAEDAPGDGEPQNDTNPAGGDPA
ncbi:NADH-quinone oxidoreductase subunit C [Streptomyces nondiastaticus]|uniref:NADH-quinone oxidoreductase subunit C n=1 Tax=Streptomyces nondiastaticus TaxID=3154512 RepID=A0ABW6U026_9ACTN